MVRSSWRVGPASICALASRSAVRHVREVIVHVVDAGRLAAAAMRAVIQRDVHDIRPFRSSSPEIRNGSASLQRLDGDVELQPRHQ